MQYFTEQIRINKKILSQYQRLLEDKNSIFIWGNGALARNIVQYCEERNIHLEGCFVDATYQKNDCGKLKVYTLGEIKKHYKNFSVIIGHSNYGAGYKKLKSDVQIKNIYCLCSICCKIWDPISTKFITENRKELNGMYQELMDEHSQKCMLSYFESRINDDASYMYDCFKNNISYYQNDVISLGNKETLLDIGACIGAAIWPFVEATKGCYKNIIALEPEKENFDNLMKNVKKRNLKNFLAKQVCAFDKTGKVKFTGNMEQGGINEDAAEYQVYPSLRVDDLWRNEKAASDISVIKINFPFSVPQILIGAKELIREKKPRIIIRIGFDERVLVETYRVIKEIRDDYKIYFRYSIGIPQGLTMFIV